MYARYFKSHNGDNKEILLENGEHYYERNYYSPPGCNVYIPTVTMQFTDWNFITSGLSKVNEGGGSGSGNGYIAQHHESNFHASFEGHLSQSQVSYLRLGAEIHNYTPCDNAFQAAVDLATLIGKQQSLGGVDDRDPLMLAIGFDKISVGLTEYAMGQPVPREVYKYWRDKRWNCLHDGTPYSDSNYIGSDHYNKYKKPTMDKAKRLFNKKAPLREYETVSELPRYSTFVHVAVEHIVYPLLGFMPVGVELI